ncbi:sodium/proline symporter PutP [Methylotetracoccus oryzae]|uniref:sodium/proline symporter PutP n=1 Tax=Methylotetracoccus oryzae TaxID=1919059 RepID=UPI00111818D1|nr:sodium/proline symporter PutP [Methylotetracoccus oryzae]
MGSSSPITTTFVLYLVAMIGIGGAAWRHTHNLSDYILGGRRLGPFVTALSAGASDMSGWLLMGLPGAIFATGLTEAWIGVGLAVGAWVNWYLVAARLRVYTELTHDALTLPDYFTYRFEDPTRLLRVLAAAVILFFFTIYCASGMVAGARLFQQAFTLDYGTALWASAAATIAYVFVGGFLAVSWTDTVQAALMIFALLLAPAMVLVELGGIPAAFAEVAKLDDRYINAFGGSTAIGVVSLLAWGLGYMGQPHILARFMAASEPEGMASARRIGMTWMVLCLSGAIAAGFFGIAYFARHPDLAAPVTQNREAVFMTLAMTLFQPWLAGLALAAILAAIMSTLSCQLLVCSSALTEDLYRAFIRPGASQRELVWFGRAMVLAVAALAMGIASDPESRVLGLVGYAWAGFGAAFGPVVLLSVTWPRMTRHGALAGMLVGAITVVLWHHGPWFGLPSGPVAGLYELVPGFLAASLAICFVSRMDRQPSATIETSFHTMRARLN